MDALKRDQFVVARGRHGTFVADRLPHRHRVGIVFPTDPSQSPSWSRMYAAIDDEARRLIHAGRSDLRIYHGTEDPESDGHHRLLRDVQLDRLAGLFIVGMRLSVFDHTPIMGHPYLRVVGLSGQRRPGVVHLGLGDIISAAIERLAGLGRRRMALIYNAYQSHLTDHFREQITRHGLAVHPNWIIPANVSAPQGARSAAYLLLSQPEGNRPDAIIVTDDYLAEQTTLGVLDAGVAAPDDVAVLVQCNFPILPPSVTPIIRMGVDLPHVLHTVLDTILADTFDADRDLEADVVHESQRRSLSQAHATRIGGSAPQALDLPQALKAVHA